MTKLKLLRRLAAQQARVAEIAKFILDPPQSQPQGNFVPVRYVELGKERYKVKGTVTYHDKTVKILQFHAGSLEDSTRKLKTEFGHLTDREAVYSIHIFMDRID